MVEEVVVPVGVDVVVDDEEELVAAGGIGTFPVNGATTSASASSFCPFPPPTPQKKRTNFQIEKRMFHFC